MPACMLDDYPLPIRSWVLHSFHDGAGHNRWPGVRGIGPVPCQCLQQLVSAPFLLERTRLQYMRNFNVRCVELPAGVTLSTLIADPTAFKDSWARFSFSVAHDSLQMSVEPSLKGQPIDSEHPRIGRLIRQVKKARAQRADKKELGRPPAPVDCTAPPPRDSPAPCIMYPLEILHASLPGLLTGPAPPLHLLVPLSRCAGGCGGRGWCEMVVVQTSGKRRAQPRCGCFVPGGLNPGVGGSACADPAVWFVRNQPSPHWGPPCLRDCSGLGVCDWQVSEQ